MDDPDLGSRLETSAFVDEKIQLFQCDYPIGHCFKCDPSEGYQFFSNNQSEMLEYSSKWLSFGNKESDESDSTESIDSVTPRPKREFTYTDIGYIENVPLFATYKYKTDPKQDASPLAKSPPNFSGHNIIEINNKNSEVLYKQNEKHIERDTESNVDNKNKLHVGTHLRTKRQYIKRNERKKTQSIASPITKLVTSRFGRKRRVIDYSLFDGDIL